MQGLRRARQPMRRPLPILATVTLLAALAASASARARRRRSPRRANSPRARWSSSSTARARGRTLPLPAGRRRAAGGDGAAAQPAGRLRRAELRRHRLGDRARRPLRPPRRPRHARRRLRSRRHGRRLDLQAVELPALGRRRDALACRSPPAASTRSAPGATWTKSGRPGAEGVTVAVLDTGIAYRDLGSKFVRSPDFAAGQFVKGYDFIDDDRLPLDENGHGTHVAGTIGEKTDNAIGLTGLAYRAKLMPVRVLDKHGRGQADRHRQGHPLRGRPPRPGDQHELQLRLRQEGAGGRRSAARSLRARCRRGRLGRQPRLGDLRLGAGDRAAGDRRRRHHRGRLPRQLLAGRQGDRPARTGRRHAGARLPLDLGAADLPGDAESGQHADLRRSPATTSAPRWPPPTSPASPRW